MKREFQFYVYIVTNWKKTTLYTGVTNNLKMRLKEHYDNRGTSKSFAGKYYCYNLVFFECYKYVNNAIDREKEIKSMNREKKIALIHTINPEVEFWNRKMCGEWPPTYKGRI